MQIIHSTLTDLNLIFEFYDIAIAHQKKVSPQHWQDFSRELVTQEIKEGRQYKVLISGEIAAIFAVTFNDVEIWQEKDQQPSIYLHRIVTHSNFRGQNLVQAITDWAVAYAKANHIQYVRMDTWADNERLLKHYVGCGFTHAGTIKIGIDSGLPKHYQGISLNLFEIKV